VFVFAQKKVFFVIVRIEIAHQDVGNIPQFAEAFFEGLRRDDAHALRPRLAFPVVDEDIKRFASGVEPDLQDVADAVAVGDFDFAFDLDRIARKQGGFYNTLLGVGDGAVGKVEAGAVEFDLQVAQRLVRFDLLEPDYVGVHVGDDAGDVFQFGPVGSGVPLPGRVGNVFGILVAAAVQIKEVFDVVGGDAHRFSCKQHQRQQHYRQDTDQASIPLSRSSACVCGSRSISL